MAHLNVKPQSLKTHEGATACRVNPELALRRSVLACMLWEDSFYEDGESIADRIKGLIPKVDPAKVAVLAREARTAFKLRHVPLLIAREMARYPKYRPFVVGVLADIIQRPDELSELLAIYWKDGRCPVAASIKKGLAAAFPKFSEYQLGKYNRDGAVKLRDALFISHAKPKDEEQAALWKRLVDGTLATPDTWEVELSAGKDKRATWIRLLAEKKLGGLALLRNLRNMHEAGVDPSYIFAALAEMKTDRILPFRFIAAAKYAPQWEPQIEATMFRCLADRPKLPGKTIVIVDVSGSMYNAGNISKHSDISRVDAAGALAAILRETCEDARIYATAGNDVRRVHATAMCPPRRGMALVDTFTKQRYHAALGGGGIFLKQCLDFIRASEKTADRIVVFTDEQDCDDKANPATADAFGRHNYLINISVEKNGVGYGPWTHIDGFSEAVLDFVRESEQ